MNMIKAILTDFSHVLLFAKDSEYTGGLNAKYDSVREQEGFDFLSVFELNTELLEYYSILNETVPVHIFTTGKVQTDPAVFSILQESFTDIFAAGELGLSKKNESTYKTMCEKIGYNPNDVLYIDDKEEHAVFARAAGLQSFQHISNDKTIKQIDSLCQSS